MKAAIYARYSSDNQREESITAQLRAAHEYCKKNDYIIVKEYTDEAISARTDERPAFQKMIEDAATGLFGVLIVHKIDRFARNRYDAAFYKRSLQKSGVRIRYIEHQLDDSPESGMLESVLEGMAEYFSKNLAREVRKGQKENALQAKHNGGTPPLGYCLTPNKEYQIDETEAPIIRKIFADYADGKSLLMIRDALNTSGYKTKKGRAFGVNSLWDLIRNEKYIGTYVYGKSTIGPDGKRNTHPKDSENLIKVENAIPAIIDRATWEKVQQQFSKKAHTRARETYLFSGLLKCDLCGSLLVGNRYQTKKGIPYAYYRCNRAQRTAECVAPKYRKEPLEELLLNKIFPLIFNEDGAKNFISVIVSQQAKFAQDTLSHIKTLEKEKAASQRKIESLIDIIETGSGNKTMLNRITEHEEKIETIESQLQLIKKDIRKITLTESQVLDLYNHIKKTKEPEAIKLLVQSFISSVTVGSETLKLHINLHGTKFGLEVVEISGIEPLTS